MKTRKGNSIGNRKGIVLPIVITFGIILAILGVGLLQMGFGSRIMSVITTSGISARTAADAGITHALYEMNSRFTFGAPWDNGWLPFSLGPVPLDNSDASYSYTIEGPFADPGTGDDYWQIVSIGTSGRETRTVNARTRFTNLFEYALIVNEEIILKSDTLLDAYDSNDGYPADPSPHFMIGTNSLESPPAGGITLNNGVIIKGDVLVGVGGNPEELIVDHGATTGNRYALAAPFSFETIPVPVPGPSLGSLKDPNLTIGAPGVTTLVRYDDIIIPNDGILGLEGEVYLHITGDLTLSQGAQMNVLPGSIAQIYLDGDLVGGNSNGINNMTLIPANFRMFGTSVVPQKWTIQNSGAFYGVYYAPMAEIIFKAKADLFGSVSGRSFDLRAAGNMHYDVQLSKLVGFDTGFTIDRWWEEHN